jgi:hypothetical protein
MSHPLPLSGVSTNKLFDCGVGSISVVYNYKGKCEVVDRKQPQRRGTHNTHNFAYINPGDERVVITTIAAAKSKPSNRTNRRVMFP